MRGVRLHHHRTARRKGRRRVSPRHRKRQGKIAGAEHRNRADADIAQPQIRPGQGLAVRKCWIDPRIQPAALAYRCGKQAQLTRGARPLGLDARHCQPGFSRGALQQRIPNCLNFRGDCLQEYRPRFQIRFTVAVERRGSQGAGGGNVLRLRFAECGL
jgi:hypothetical protein